MCSGLCVYLYTHITIRRLSRSILFSYSYIVALSPEKTKERACRALSSWSFALIVLFLVHFPLSLRRLYYVLFEVFYKVIKQRVILEYDLVSRPSVSILKYY